MLEPSKSPASLCGRKGKFPAVLHLKFPICAATVLPLAEPHLFNFCSGKGNAPAQKSPRFRCSEAILTVFKGAKRAGLPEVTLLAALPTLFDRPSVEPSFHAFGASRSHLAKGKWRWERCAGQRDPFVNREWKARQGVRCARKYAPAFALCAMVF